MIASLKGKWASAIAEGRTPRGFPSTLIRATQRKLYILEHAQSLDDLRSPPGNRLEALKGDRAGQHSVRFNDQFRVCFRWVDGDAYEVEITDYH